MLKPNKQEQKEQIIQSIRDLDIMALLKNGFKSFISYICDDNQLTFAEFVEKTGELFDYTIEKISRDEQLDYVGGKMIMQLASPAAIKLTADLYFQNAGGEWILKQMGGQIKTAQFSDWGTAEEFKTLRTNKTIDYSIDPPEER